MSERGDGNDVPLKQRVEAVLYIAGRPLTLEEISEAAKAKGKASVRNAIGELKEEYQERGSALTIVSLPGEKYVMQLHEKLAPYAEKVAPDAVLSEQVMKTLSVIAFLQPVKQSHIVRARGKAAYSHIKELEFKGFIRSERAGLTKILRTTDYFAEYFRLSKNVAALKRQLGLRVKAGRLHPTQTKTEMES
nr:SMC-Scp complex subunit ScpB [Candidatus Freyrarchaeum guaymaensis]